MEKKSELIKLIQEQEVYIVGIKAVTETQLRAPLNFLFIIKQSKRQFFSNH